MIDALITLIIFCFLGTGTPGPNNIMLMTSGMNYGLRRSLPHIFGVAFGVPVMVIAVGVGLSQAFAALPWLEETLKIVCAAYLLYLAYRIATARPKVTDAGVEVSGKPLTLWQAAAFQWVNPKAWFIVTTALSVYTPPVSTPFIGTLLVACGFAISGNCTAFTWTALGDRLRLFFEDPLRLRVFNITAAVLLVLTLVPVFWPEAL